MAPMKHRGMLISIEGGEGAGKSTVLHAVRDLLVDRGLDVVLTREPGGTACGEAIRQSCSIRTASLAPRPNCC